MKRSELRVGKVKEAIFSSSGMKFGGTLPFNFVGLANNIVETDGNGSPKLAVDVSAVEDEIQPYLSMPEAEAYKAAIQAYIVLCKARNAKVI
ncbi:hypothetical protein AJ79_09605 [Helicocarpus griseus UAMH5409]|uniref:Uncharacterized protein n=1 Tax=Helicocarpus griseus UAMH5409 TaxID=1447875 RepID=A0A2B7WIS6_9EURO|nr:hypothetical protein AJ79_09605 [Helicocarpus griseus UAMH5409]